MNKELLTVEEVELFTPPVTLQAISKLRKTESQVLQILPTLYIILHDENIHRTDFKNLAGTGPIHSI